LIKAKDTAEHLSYTHECYDNAVAALADLEPTVQQRTVPRGRIIRVKAERPASR
jgi:hypothetical protein